MKKNVFIGIGACIIIAQFSYKVGKEKGMKDQNKKNESQIQLFQDLSRVLAKRIDYLNSQIK